MDYKLLINERGIKSIKDLSDFFYNVVSMLWISEYKLKTKLVGEITSQEYFGFTYLFDDTYSPLKKGILKEPVQESRVIGVYGSANMNVNHSNRVRMKGHPRPQLKNSNKSFDRGHFIAHRLGGPIDINLFPQRSDINRGIYRVMESNIDKGSFVFCRPFYNDLTYCPVELEYGFFDDNLNFDGRNFINR